MKVFREWAMPSSDTLSIKPIRKWVMEKCKGFERLCDPFARDCQFAHITNDLNPDTKAKYHMKADEFLALDEAKSDLVIFDPPYSLRQVKECYEGFGYGFTQFDSQNVTRWTKERDLIASFQEIGNGVISFGWTSTCMGKERGYRIEEILLCSHGPAHNDTICTFEIKIEHQGDLFK